MGIRLLPRGVEEAAFKPVVGGWLFTTGEPLTFKPRRTYFVTDAQKPALAAKVRRSRYANMAAVLVEVPLIMAATAKYPWLLSLSPKAFAAWGAAVAVVIALSILIDHLVLGAAVRDLPPSTQTIGMADVWTQQKKAMSTGVLAFFTAFGVLCASVNAYTAMTQGKILVGLGAAFMAFLAIYFGTMLVAKLRAKPSDNTTADAG